MAYKFEISNGTNTIDLTAAPFVITGEKISIGAPVRTDVGKKKLYNRKPASESDWTNGTITFSVRIEASDLDDLRLHYQGLKRILCSPEWTLTHNAGGSTDVDRTYHCFEYSVIPPVDQKVQSLYVYTCEIQAECRPFCDAPIATPPRNYVKNAIISGCSGGPNAHGDYIPDGFTLMINGTPTYSITQDDEWTKIEVSGGAAGEYVGIYQSGINLVAGALISERIAFKCNAATGGASYQADVIEYGGSAYPSLISGRTAAATAQEAKSENRTVSGGTSSLMIRAWITLSASGTGTLWVKNGMVTRGAALPKGDDGNTFFYCTELTMSPGTMRFENTPGDVPALAFLNVIQGSASVTTTNRDQFFIGMAKEDCTPLEGRMLVDSFYGTADVHCLGGQCTTPQAHSAETVIRLPRLRGTYLVLARLLTTSTSFATDTFQLNLYPNRDRVGTAISTPTALPFLAQGRWTEPVVMGLLDFPAGTIPDLDFISSKAAPENSLGIKSNSGTTGNWWCDFLAFLPVSTGYGRALGLPSIAKQQGVIFDTISDFPGIYNAYQINSFSVSVSVNGSETLQGFWASYADYQARLLSVDLPSACSTADILTCSNGVTAASVSGTVMKFNIPVGVTTFVFTTDPWALSNLSSVTSIEGDHEWDEMYLSDCDMLIAASNYVNDTHEKYMNAGVLLQTKLQARYLL